MPAQLPTFLYASTNSAGNGFGGSTTASPQSPSIPVTVVTTTNTATVPSSAGPSGPSAAASKLSFASGSGQSLGRGGSGPILSTPTESSSSRMLFAPADGSSPRVNSLPPPPATLQPPSMMIGVGLGGPAAPFASTTPPVATSVSPMGVSPSGTRSNSSASGAPAVRLDSLLAVQPHSSHTSPGASPGSSSPASTSPTPMDGHHSHHTSIMHMMHGVNVVDPTTSGGGGTPASTASSSSSITSTSSTASMHHVSLPPSTGGGGGASSNHSTPAASPTTTSRKKKLPPVPADHPRTRAATTLAGSSGGGSGLSSSGVALNALTVAAINANLNPDRDSRNHRNNSSAAAFVTTVSQPAIALSPLPLHKLTGGGSAGGLHVPGTTSPATHGGVMVDHHLLGVIGPDSKSRFSPDASPYQSPRESNAAAPVGTAAGGSSAAYDPSRAQSAPHSPARSPSHSPPRAGFNARTSTTTASGTVKKPLPQPPANRTVARPASKTVSATPQNSARSPQLAPVAASITPPVSRSAAASPISSPPRSPRQEAMDPNAPPPAAAGGKAIAKKAMDLLYGGNKSKKNKIFDRLGVVPHELEVFKGNPKLYAQLGALVSPGRNVPPAKSKDRPQTASASGSRSAAASMSQTAPARSLRESLSAAFGGGKSSSDAPPSGTVTAPDGSGGYIPLSSIPPIGPANPNAVPFRPYVAPEPTAVPPPIPPQVHHLRDGGSISLARIPPKAADLLFGSQKQLKNKWFDKLGVTPKEMAQFERQPKAYLKLGIYNRRHSAPDVAAAAAAAMAAAKSEAKTKKKTSVGGTAAEAVAAALATTSAAGANKPDAKSSGSGAGARGGGIVPPSRGGTNGPARGAFGRRLVRSGPSSDAEDSDDDDAAVSLLYDSSDHQFSGATAFVGGAMGGTLLQLSDTADPISHTISIGSTPASGSIELDLFTDRKSNPTAPPTAAAAKK